jgi:nucleoid DNA-binding protein
MIIIQRLNDRLGDATHARGAPYHLKGILVTKKDMAKGIADELGIAAVQASTTVQRVFDRIVETLANEGRIELRNFGVFEVKRRKARQARNPRTGVKVSVPEKMVVTFKPGKEMEERISQSALVHRRDNGAVANPDDRYHLPGK